MIVIYILIVSLSLCCGFVIATMLKKKYQFYKSFVELLDAYKINLNFLQLSMREFIDRETKTKPQLQIIKDILFGEKKIQIGCQMFLKQEELDEILKFVCGMGQLNCESELEKTEKAKLVFFEKQNKCKLNYDRYGSASIKIGLLVGLLIVILML